MTAPLRALSLVLLALSVALVAAGCGSGGATTTTRTVGVAGKGVKPSRLTEKIGLVPVGGGRYRLGDCVASAVLTSPAAIERGRQAGEKVVVDPTGSIGIETGDGARCRRVMEEAVAFVNVP